MGSLLVLHGPDAPSDGGALRRMVEAAPHRGRACASASVGRAVLGVTFHEDRPDAWVAGHDGTAAAFAGVLDDAEPLAAELRRAGAVLRGPDPASLLLAAFGRWGEGALDRLRGAFTGAVADGEGVRVFRDQFGFRPLYRRAGPGTFVAATEAKQVVAGAGIAREPDLEEIERAFFGDPGSGSSLRGVVRVPRASIAHADPSGRFRTRRYWDPRSSLEAGRDGVAEAVEGIRHHLEVAARRMVTGDDVVLLSGGIDSPAVAAFAAPEHRRRGGRPLRALSAVYPDHPSVDERPWIEMVAGHLDLPLTTFAPHHGPLDGIRDWVQLLDGPVDSLSIAEVADAYARAAGLGRGAVLTGELAEYGFELRHYLLDHLITRGRWGAVARQLRARRDGGASAGRLVRQVLNPLVPPSLAVARIRRRGTDHRELPPWIDPSLVGGLGDRPDLARRPRDRWSESQVAPFFGPATTFDADDVLAAHAGVTVRRPFG
ncbi:MAG: hypothetical protein HY658_05870, partial [Actinobacteria bacterium]|nr:hypothetical protein [Actinomycetota bacterium]